MKQIAVLLAALVLLFGCAIPQMGPEINSTIIPLPKVPKLNFTENVSNSTGNVTENLTPWGNPVQNSTPAEPALVPRNISDKIYDGQFDIPDPSGAPLKIYVLDAGYADSILINKGEFNMLVDDGNSDLVDPILKNMNIGQLDVVVATKDDPGAFSGIPGVMDEFTVGELWDNGNAVVSPEYAAMREKAAGMGIPIKHPRAGDSMELGGLNISVLNPQNGKQNSNPDNDAIVLKVKNGEFCTVFFNPIVQDWENVVITAAGSDGVNCSVMTYFKHGEGRPAPPVSLEKVAPRDVIISVGNNSDGLPSPTTLTLLGMSSIVKHVWRTDLDGTIEIVNYGHPAYEITPEIAQNATAN